MCTFSRKCGVFLPAFCCFVLSGCESEKSKTVTLTSANFEQIVLASKQPVLVDFWATWCGPCRQMDPVIKELASELQGKVVVGKVNVDDFPDIARKFDIDAIPTMLVFKDGQLKKRLQGIRPKEFLTNVVGALQ